MTYRQSRRRMLGADILELMQQKDREIRQPPNPPRRRQPKVTRHASRRQRIANAQTKNPIKAIYAEKDWAGAQLAQMGPTNEAELTRNVGPSDMDRNAFSPAKATGTTTGAYRYDRPERRTRVAKAQAPKRRKAEDWVKLAEEYL